MVTDVIGHILLSLFLDRIATDRHGLLDPGFAGVWSSWIVPGVSNTLPGVGNRPISNFQEVVVGGLLDEFRVLEIIPVGLLCGDPSLLRNPAHGTGRVASTASIHSTRACVLAHAVGDELSGELTWICMASLDHVVPQGSHS